MSELQNNPRQLADGSWVDSTGTLQWDGTAWRPVQRKRGFPTWAVSAIAVVAIGMVFGAARILVDSGSHTGSGSSTQSASTHAPTPDTVQNRNFNHGITNVTWDASKVTFDYRSISACAHLQFAYDLTDANGALIYEGQDTSTDSFAATTTYHITTTFSSDARAALPQTKQIEIKPQCRG